MPRKSRRTAASLAPSGRAGGSDRLGPRLRAARETAGVTVRGLARNLGVSASLVSQIETGRVMPSVGTLYAMANELGLLVDDLFRDAEAPPQQASSDAGRARPGPVQRSRGRETIHLSGGVHWERLTPTSDAEVEFLYVVYDVGATSCEEDALIRHGGKEYAYLLSGRLGIRVGFEEFELRPGDSISFDAQNPHRLWTIGDKPAVAVWVVLNRHADRRRRKRP
ncbi:MAG: helix-turn-helix domain-containing protein [Rhodoplanes sp.]